MKNFNLQDLHDTKTRDLLRGLLDKNRDLREHHATSSRLLKSVHSEDLQILDGLIRHNALFRHIETIPEFPTDSPFEDYPALSLVPHGKLAIEYIAHRISENEARICEAFQLLKALNTAIHNSVDEPIVSALNDIIERLGHSLTLARKAAFITGFTSKDSLSHRLCVELLSGYVASGKHYGMMATIDTIGTDFDYLDLKYRFRNYVTSDLNAHIYRRIAYHGFEPLAATKEELVTLLSTSYEISLIDAAIALMSHIDEGITTAAIPNSVNDAWRAFSTQPSGRFKYFSENNPFVDLHAFRAAAAFIEHAAYRRIRYAWEPLYDLPTAGPRNTIARQTYTAAFFADVNTISAIVADKKHDVAALPEKFSPQTAGMLASSCAVVWVCEKEPNFSGITTEVMARLMGQTFDIDRLVAPNLLRRAVGTASDPFVKLILQTLLRAHSSITKDNYNFKEQFQKYVREYHRGNILDFMDKILSLDKSIIHYFVNMLDETLLSQMPFLMASSESIYETRAQLLEWFAEKTDNSAARSKAKELRLDRKIAAVRGAINETRLNIDSVRFRQWIEQNKLSDFSDFIRLPLPNLPSIGELMDSSKAATLFLAVHREPSKLALQALTQCYEEFCKNPDFGIASFLGRRIRHGTIRGTLMNNVPSPEDVQLPHATAAQYQSWHREFSKSVNSLQRSLYFRSKSSQRFCLLSAEIDTEQKWQLSLVSLAQIHAQAKLDHGVAFLPLLIEQFCWLAFEVELTKAQTAIGEARSKWGALKLRCSSSDEVTTAFEKATNIALSDKFNTVISWFRKPPNISPSAEIAHVIQVVVQEARDEYPTFIPRVDFTGDIDLQLSGAIYYIVYDALTIAVRNAAKHGQHPGLIDIKTDINEVGSGKVLEISVTSLLRQGDNIDSALSRIESAGRQGATNADIEEEKSGIRKLKKMMLERGVLRFEAAKLDAHPDRLFFSITMPFEGIVK